MENIAERYAACKFFFEFKMIRKSDLPWTIVVFVVLLFYVHGKHLRSYVGTVS